MLLAVVIIGVVTIAFHVPSIHRISELDLVQIPMSVIEEMTFTQGKGFSKITKAAWETWNRPRCVGSGPEFSPFTQRWRLDVGAQELKQVWLRCHREASVSCVSP